MTILRVLAHLLICHASTALEATLPSAFENDSDLTARDMELYRGFYANRFVLAPHLGTFVLPYSYNARPHDEIYANFERAEDNASAFYKKAEAEFQISFSVPLYRGLFGSEWDFLFAYTHHSYWQIYNQAWSRPFRETNYQPELFARRIVTKNIHHAGLALRAIDAGYVHQSNGQIQVVSRSWDRAFVRAFFRGRDRGAFVNLWARIPEIERGDDNPWIYAYRGFGDLTYSQKLGASTLSLSVPFQFAHYGFGLKWTYPWRDNIRWMISYDEGYGHSLIEMDKPVTRIAFGLALESIIDQ